MYLSKKVLIGRFILYRLLYLIFSSTFFIIILPKIPGFSQNNHYRVKIYFVDMDYVDESDVVMFTVKLTLPCT